MAVSRRVQSEHLSRRRFLEWGALGAGAFLALTTRKASAAAAKFFTVSKQRGRWWFITPRGERFFSLGLNHIDAASLRYPENRDIWRQRYGNSMQRWLTESVQKNLRAWGFNSVGWVQEVVTRDEKNHRHSRNFTFEEYQWLDMPYCHMLPFVDFHQWEVETRHPDLHGKGFEEWCDYVARAHCARFVDDPKLIGYFYSDCPMWVHVRKDNTWKGPLFDPERLKSEAGQKELFRLAERYYKVTHAAIRRYDPHHLILGDRYEANAPLPEQVLDAARPYVDVFSFQCFGGSERARKHLGRWGTYLRRPVLLADGASWRKPHVRGAPRHQNPEEYRRVIDCLMAIPEAVGYHLCGAYVRNRVRRFGLLDDRDRPDETAVAGIKETNARVHAWCKERSE